MRVRKKSLLIIKITDCVLSNVALKKLFENK